MKLLAIRHNDAARKLMDKGNLKGAEREFVKAAELAPSWSVPWYNLGLVYKKQRRWQKSLECNQRAAKLDPADEAAWWNLGIAATAVGDWSEARRAWQAYGVKLEPGDTPPEMELGLTPIRINPGKAAEVVWCQRIDPARAIIQNVPLAKSQRRYHDLLLHDGQPNGYRQHNGHEVPVFDELGVIMPSMYATYEVIVEAAEPEARQALVEAAEAASLGIEDWSTIRMLCQQCSQGRPHKHHEPQPADSGPLVRYGLAAPTDEAVEKVLEQWRTAHPGCLVLELQCVLKNYIS